MERWFGLTVCGDSYCIHLCFKASGLSRNSTPILLISTLILKDCKHLGSSPSEETEALTLTKMTQCRDALFAKVESKIKYARHSLLGQVHLYSNSYISV